MINKCDESFDTNPTNHLSSHWKSMHNLSYTVIFQTIHNCDVIMIMMASQITSLTIVYSTVYSGADQRKHQSSMSLAFVRGILQWPVNSPLKGTIKRKMFSFDDVIVIIKKYFG